MAFLLIKIIYIWTILTEEKRWITHVVVNNLVDLANYNTSYLVIDNINTDDNIQRPCYA